MRISSLYRYPVKGLSPQATAAATLTAGAYFPGDRLYAIENGPSGFDEANPVHQPKIKYLMLMRNESLAKLKTRYDDDSSVLEIHHRGGVAARGALSSEEGRAAISDFLTGYMPDELRGPVKVLAAPQGYRFTDSRSGFVSLINLASVGALESIIGAPVHPLRFRGNIYLENLAPWSEFDLVGKTIRVGDHARLKVTKRIERCAATNVDPSTGARDMMIPRTLMNSLGHVDCGVYAEVIAGGVVKPGDALAAIAD